MQNVKKDKYPGLHLPKGRGMPREIATLNLNLMNNE